MFIMSESPSMSKPRNIRESKDKIIFECVLQTVNECNRNKRYYSSSVLKEGVNKIMPRIKEGSLLGELDHPCDSNPVRQVTVLYKEASHKFMELGWDGNKLVGVLETLRTPNGTILKNLAEDGVPVGFSFRGMGDLRQTFKEGKTIFEVKGPLQTVTWDCVSYPSHQGANLIKITESDCKALQESVGAVIAEEDGMVLTEAGTFEANEYDEILNNYVANILSKFSR